MPAQVVVVKRSRRRAFAILRSIPAWLRAVLLTYRTKERSKSTFDLSSFEAFRLTRHSTTIEAGRDASLLALERQSGVLSPALVAGSDLGECLSCRRCVEICPSDALDLGKPLPQISAPESNSTSISTSMMSFNLDPGRCIGCGDCARICPSKILEMVVVRKRVGEGAKPALRPLNADECR